MGLICELEFSEMHNNYFLFNTLEDDSSGYVYSSECEIVFIHNGIIYNRKLLDDKIAFEQKKRCRNYFSYHF